MAVFVVFLVLTYFHYTGLTISVERNDDIILCRDTRLVDSAATGRFRTAPTYHLFYQDMAEVGHTHFYTDRTLSDEVEDKAKVAQVQARQELWQELFRD